MDSKGCTIEAPGPTSQPISTGTVVPSHGRLAHSLFYMVSSAAAIRGGSFVFGILLRRIIGPQLIGVWNLVEIVITCLCAVTVGTGYSAERLIPQYRARREGHAEAQTRNSLFTWTATEGVFLCVSVIAYYIIFGGRHSSEMRVALIALPFLFFAQKLISIHIMLLKCTKEFRLYSLYTLGMSVLDWSIVGFAYFWSFHGLLAGSVIVAMIKLWGLRRASKILPAFVFRWDIKLSGLRNHLPYGPQYAAFKAVWTVAERLDSILVGYLAGTAALAYYYLGFQFSTVALEVPIALAYIAFPNLLERFSLSQGGVEFSREFLRYLRLDLFVIVPCILPLGYFGSEFVILNVLPAFGDGVAAVKICMLTVAILAVRYLYYQVLMAHQRIGKLVIVTGAQIAVLLISVLSLKPFVDNPLILVALSAYIASAVHLLLVARIATAMMIARDIADSEGVIAAWWCIVWGALLLAVDQVMPASTQGSVTSNLLLFTTQTVLFWLLAAPLCYLKLGSVRAELVKALNVLPTRRLREYFAN